MRGRRAPVQAKINARIAGWRSLASAAGRVICAAASIVCVATLLYGADQNANELVTKYKSEVLVLRGNVEHERDKKVATPGWESDVRNNAINLANSMGRIDDTQLEKSKLILKYEYGGWAFLMAADTYGAKPQTNTQQSEYAMAAINEFDKALDLMRAITDDYQHDKKGAAALYDWIAKAPSWDVNRTHYLKAAAIADVTLAGGARTEADVKDELSKIDAIYFQVEQPAEDHPALAWALQSKSNRPVRSPIPEDFWAWFRDHLWWELVLAIPTIAGWVYARYRKLSVIWQWAAFTIMELLLVLGGVAAGVHYGWGALAPLVILVLALQILTYWLTRRSSKRPPAAASENEVEDKP